MIFVGEILFRHECVHRGNESHDQCSDLRRRLLLRVQLGKHFVSQVAFQKQSLAAVVGSKDTFHIFAGGKADDLQTAASAIRFLKNFEEKNNG